MLSMSYSNFNSAAVQASILYLLLQPSGLAFASFHGENVAIYAAHCILKSSQVPLFSKCNNCQEFPVSFLTDDEI